MKTLCGILTIVVVFFICGINVKAQQSPSLESLKEQIRTLEQIDRDPNTPPEVKTLNQSFLAERRSQLRDLTQKRIDSLRAYLSSVRASLSSSEIERVQQAIDELQTSLAEPQLKASADSAAAAAPVSGPTTATPDSNARSAANTPRVANAVAEVRPAAPQTPLTPVTDCTSDNSYTNAPPLLTEITERVADDIVNGKNAEEMVAGSFAKMYSYTVADALTVNSPVAVRTIRSLKAYQYLGETARIDKQVGAGSSSSGTTSAIEKPGFARLLGFAIEKGAILKDVEGSSLTLSTSPYVLFTMNGDGDTAENYARAGLLNRIGVSATFNIEDQNSVLASARRNQLTDWSVRARLYGDRSTRSKAFQKAWRDDIQPAIERRLAVLSGVERFISLHQSEFPDLDGTNDQVDSAVASLMNSAAYKDANDADKKKMLSNTILCNIKSGVFDDINAHPQRVSESTRNQIVNNFVPSLAAALDNLEVVRGVLKDKLDALAKGPLATFAYTNHREPATSDYSEFKFLFEQDKTLFGMLNIVGNASFTMYNKPNALLNQSRIRDINAALSFEGAVDSPFLKNQPDLSKITYAFTGTYQRMRENEGLAGRKPDLVGLQFKLDVPIYGGFNFPIALTYTNGTEHTNRNDKRLNFGFKFDMDKLFALTKLIGMP